MKKITLVLLYIAFYATAQTKPEIAKSAIKIEMLFPEGKSKALILSYDDGAKQDRQLVQLMNKYHLIGTFHLNSNKLSTNSYFDYLNKEEIKELYKGHEVSVHTANHPNLPDMNTIDIIYEIVDDRRELERLVGYPVRGMAYPFGNTNDAVIDAINGLGIEYARTVGDTYNFEIPLDFLRWHPTIHQFAKAYWEPNQPEKDTKELEFFHKILNNFLQTKELALLDIWGHSWEMGTDQNKWEETEKFFKLLANNDDIYYTKQIDLVDYIKAFRNLKFGVNKNVVYNSSSTNVTCKINNRIYSIPAGANLFLDINK
ncbi:putative polysaccharide deacetylase [Flavobacterium branchiophilum]|uniref:Probable polysaccharide deacetylase n=1 Tax=Flavobacterium branchiophilum (strain FL-15) TaxID=1034807 RepID=G2Z2L8_FLABF|nr:polysaccharide deacetylase family protein [Flavobacterium branchiophilum]CCB70190.1 Probable polysaccharide deacetylase precursor [Flavobacterium branchiophilum FL-15]